MSDDPTTEADDELVSAYLDGEVTPEEMAAVEASPVLLARVEQLRAVVTTVASVPLASAPDAARETSIAAALAAAEVRFEITDLAAERARRRLRVLSIAAAVLVAIAVGAGLLAQAGRDSGTTSTAAKTSVASSSSSAERSSSAGSAAADQAPTADAFALSTNDLGAFDDTTDLVSAVRGRLEAAKTTSGPVPAAGSGTGDAAPQDSAGGGVPPSSPAPCARPDDVVFDGIARLDGAAVTVLIVGPPEHQVIELLDSTCAVVFSQPL
jgi:hypothetical protein